MGHRYDSREGENRGAAMLARIRSLLHANMPDDSGEPLVRRKLVGKFAVMYLNQRLAERPDRTSETEELLAELSFWWAMHHVAANVRPEGEPHALPDDLNLLS